MYHIKIEIITKKIEHTNLYNIILLFLRHINHIIICIIGTNIQKSIYTNPYVLLEQIFQLNGMECNKINSYK